MDIEVKGLTKTYGTQRAVDNISFGVSTGEILGFLGPNGAGKTTTMKILTCYMAPSAGNVQVNGYNINDNPDDIKTHIGYLPEYNPLYEGMPVIDYLQFVATLQGLDSKKTNERIHEMVRVCGLDAEKHKRIGELSKGFQQRVGLAQAIIHDPEVLLLDEPTSGLDPNQIIEIRELIKQLGKQKTVILSTHILPEVEATCDRILIINDGSIVADGSPEKLRQERSGGDSVRVTIEDVPDGNQAFEALQGLQTVSMVDPVNGQGTTYEVTSSDSSSARKDIFNMCVEKGWTLTELTPQETRLEDIFRQLTSGE